MNYHHIDYMIKEQRRSELEKCKRMRLLQKAGFTSYPDIVSRKVLSPLWIQWNSLVQSIRRLCQQKFVIRG